MKIDPQIIKKTREEARASSRKRAVTCLHKPEDITQKMINAALSGTYFRPHRHDDLPRQETFEILKGKIAIVIFNDDGSINYSKILKRGDAFQMPLNAYHSISILSKEAVIYETSEGKFNPKTYKTFAIWAPEENTPESLVYNAALRRKVKNGNV